MFCLTNVLMIILVVSTAIKGLIFQGPAKIQIIMGAGFPLDLQDESVIVGIVIKGHYALPDNGTDITSPSIHYERRRKRSAAAAFNRWDIYKVLERYAESYGMGGKECLLRTICELAANPVVRDEESNANGLLHEILHVLFRPSSTSLAESPKDYRDRDYYAAEKLGRLMHETGCAQLYKDCERSYVDLFTFLSSSASSSTHSAST